MALTDTDLAVRPGCPTGLGPVEAAGPAADPAAFVRSSADGLMELDLLVRGARCAGCLRKIETGLSSHPGVSSARLNLSTGKLAVRWRAGETNPRAITQAVVDLGYAAAPFDPGETLKEEDKVGRSLLIAMAVAGFASMNAMMFSVPIWSANFNGEMEIGTRTMFHWIMAAICLPAAAWAGVPFFTSAWNALKKGRANMDVPISLAVLLAAGVSVFETARQGHHAYFDAVVMLLFLLLIGRYLDHKLRQKARAAARDLLALQAVTASRLMPDGATVSIPTREVRPGDLLVVLPGDRVPVDAVVEEGVSDADLSLLTGETAAVALGAGEAVRAGAVNLTGRLVLRATAASQDSFLAEIARLVETGQQTKSRYVRLADKAAELYVPVVHTAAALTFVGWLIAGADPAVALMNAAAVLIITCPCALGLAVPAVQVVATGRLFQDGILVKSGDALERLAAVTRVAFDKTGVLTLGQPRLSAPADAGVLDQAARLARASRHPLARAVARAAGPGPAAADARETAGCGVEGTVDGARARLGRADWAGAGDGAASAETELWYVRDGDPPQRFAFADTVRADAADTVKGLNARGLSSEILSGDRVGAVYAAARATGIHTYAGGQTPADKAARLDALSAEGAKVLMVGDGLNDAPALARASVSMAPGAAADASQSAADLVFQGDRLAAVTEAIDVARLARERVMENFWFSALYNLIAAPLAMAGLVTPFIAAIAMSSSSLIVTLNALRLAKPGQKQGA